MDELNSVQTDEALPNADSDAATGTGEAMDQQAFAEKMKAGLEKLDPLRRLEAVLFLASEPLHSRKLSQLAALQDGTQARSLIKQLNRSYDDEGRAFRIKQVAGGFQIRTRPMFADWLKKIQNAPSSIRLSGPAMETLSVVAYRQPVMKSEIEAVRGVSCGELLRQLLDRGLVKITGRSNELGNPLLYGTTRRFLEVFGLASIESLPRGGKLRGKGLPDWSLTTTDPESENNENSGKTGNNPLDESRLNSQNVVELDDSTNQLPQEDPEEE